MDLEQLKQQLEQLYPHKVAINVHEHAQVYRAIRKLSKGTHINKFLDSLGYTNIRKSNKNKPTKTHKIPYTGAYTEEYLKEYLTKEYPDKVVSQLSSKSPTIYKHCKRYADGLGISIRDYIASQGFTYASTSTPTAFVYKESTEVRMLSEQDLIDLLTGLYPLKFIADKSLIDDALDKTVRIYARYKGATFTEALELLGFIYLRQSIESFSEHLRTLHDRLLKIYPNRRVSQLFLDDMELYHDVITYSSEENLAIDQSLKRLGFFYIHPLKGKYTEQFIVDAYDQLRDEFPNGYVYNLHTRLPKLAKALTIYASTREMGRDEVLQSLGFVTDFSEVTENHELLTARVITERLSVLFPDKIVSGIASKDKHLAPKVTQYAHFLGKSIAELLDDLGFGSRNYPTSDAYRLRYIELALKAQYPNNVIQSFEDIPSPVAKALKDYAQVSVRNVGEVLEQLGFTCENPPPLDVFLYTDSAGTHRFTEQDLIARLEALYPLRLIEDTSPIDDALKGVLCSYADYQHITFTEVFKLLGFIYRVGKSEQLRKPLQVLHDRLLEIYPNRQVSQLFLDDSTLYYEVIARSAKEQLEIDQFLFRIGFIYTHPLKGKYTEQFIVGAYAKLQALYPNGHVRHMRKKFPKLHNELTLYASARNMTFRDLLVTLGFRTGSVTATKNYREALVVQLRKLYPDSVVRGFKTKDGQLSIEVARYAKGLGKTTAELLDDLGFVSVGFPSNDSLRLKYIERVLTLYYPDKIISASKDIPKEVSSAISTQAKLSAMRPRKLVEMLGFTFRN